MERLFHNHLYIRTLRFTVIVILCWGKKAEGGK